MHIKMQVRTFKLAKNFSGIVSTCPDSTGKERERGKGRGREERRGKGKGRRYDRMKGEQGRHGEFGWGGELRHCN